MRLKLLLFIVAPLYLCSCTSLRVATTVLKAYPALPDSVEVAIFENDKTPPESAIPLARISLFDSGASKSYKYDEVLNLAKMESRKIGGNIFYVTDVTKPNVWGSSSFQISGTALRSDTIGMTEIPNGELRSLSDNRKPFRPLPATCEVFVNYGYSGLLGSNGDLRGDLLTLAKEINSGYTIDAGLFFYPKSWRRCGMGLLYSNFFSSTNYSGLTNHVNIGYIGLDVPYKCYLSKTSDRWFFKLDYGLGYLYMKNKIKTADNGALVKMSSSTLGANLGVGFEYSMTKRLAIHTEARVISGVFRKIKYSDGTPTQKLEPGQKISAGRANLTVGLLLRIGK